MRHLALLIILIATTGVAMSQQRPKYETVPDHTVLLAIASQANCPIKIESATFLKRVNEAGVLIKYRIRNVSNKPIEFVSLMIQSSSGTGENFMPLGRSGRLLPNETIESAREGIDYDVVGVYKSEKKSGSPGEELKTIDVLLVDRVLFTDGTKYEDTRTRDALSRFFLDACCR